MRQGSRTPKASRSPRASEPPPGFGVRPPLRRFSYLPADPQLGDPPPPRSNPAFSCLFLAPGSFSDLFCRRPWKRKFRSPCESRTALIGGTVQRPDDHAPRRNADRHALRLLRQPVGYLFRHGPRLADSRPLLLARVADLQRAELRGHDRSLALRRPPSELQPLAAGRAPAAGERGTF